MTYSWKPVLDDAWAAKAVAAARGALEKMSDPVRVAAAAPAGWTAASPCSGYAGLAMMHDYACACLGDSAGESRAEKFLGAAVRAAEEAGTLSMGLFEGFGGLCFAAAQISGRDPDYTDLKEQMDGMLLEMLAAGMENAPDRHGLPFDTFDLIHGYTGIGVYLLSASGGSGRNGSCLAAVLRYLVRIAEENESGIPHWYTPPEFLIESIRENFPAGGLNCGLSHGIPGPLALMALSKSRGVEVPGMTETMSRISGWISDRGMENQNEILWPAIVPVELARRIPLNVAPARTAWCYGNPGVARSLWLAGKALHRPKLLDLAVRGMESACRRPQSEGRIDSPTFCHGVAGLLMTTLRFAHDTGNSFFTEKAEALSRQLITLYEPDSIFGFSDATRDGERVDDPALLTGAAGVAMALLAAACPVEPAWDRFFLLS